MAFLRVPSGKAAARLVFCLDRLRDLAQARPDQAHVWHARRKALGFLVAFYDLRSIAEGCPLSSQERKEVAETAGVLRAPARSAPRVECEEVRELRREARRTFEGTAFSRFPFDARR
jgi:hypothetical protein